MRWQLSQAALVCTWLAGLPATSVPLWQFWHVPGATPTWLNLAPTKVLVEWQVSHAAVVGTCCCGIVTLPRAKRMLATWQAAQSRGVPLKMPFWWHDSQRVCAWVPVSAKPVFRWSKSFCAAPCANARLAMAPAIASSSPMPQPLTRHQAVFAIGDMALMASTRPR